MTRDKLLPQMSEDNLLGAVMQLAKLEGWRITHFRPARTAQGWRTAIQGDKGWPDLAMVRGDRFLVVELKAEKGTVTTEQELWIGDLLHAGVEAHVWRPVDWYFGTIGRELRRDRE